MEVSSNADEIYERSRGNFYLKANRHLLHFILPWLVGVVWWGSARWCGESGLIFPFFFLPVSPPASQSDCENISLTEAAREQRDRCKQPMRFMTAPNKAEPQLFLSPVIFVLHLNSLYSTSSPLPPKKCVIQALASWSENINDSLARWLRGAHDALWALQERRSICSAGRASWQRGAVGWHRSQPL